MTTKSKSDYAGRKRSNLLENEIGIIARRSYRLESAGTKASYLPEEDKHFTKGRNRIYMRRKLEFTNGRSWILQEEEKLSTGGRQAVYQRKTNTLPEEDRQSSRGR